ncbi:hypothetical protein BS020_RS16490 [Vibrio parahaemolyticus]|nr:hypothetical protein [Vibrio parahaemolyticus]
MKKLFSSLQLHFFTNNDDVPATSAVIKELMSNLDSFDLMPTFGNEFNHQTNESRKFACMVTSDESFKVQFLSGDIFISAENYDLEAFVKRSVQILESLAKLYPQKRAGRISILFTEAFIGSEELYNKAFTSLFTDNSKTPFEWDNRIVHKVNSFERLNSVEVVTRAVVQPTNSSMRHDALVYDFDINTEFENQTARFALQNANEYYQKIFEHLSDIKANKYKRLETTYE